MRVENTRRNCECFAALLVRSLIPASTWRLNSSCTRSARSWVPGWAGALGPCARRGKAVFRNARCRSGEHRRTTVSERIPQPHAGHPARKNRLTITPNNRAVKGQDGCKTNGESCLVHQLAFREGKSLAHKVSETLTHWVQFPARRGKFCLRLYRTNRRE